MCGGRTGRRTRRRAGRRMGGQVGGQSGILFYSMNMGGGVGVRGWGQRWVRGGTL